MKCDQAVAAYIEHLRQGFACVPASHGRMRVITPYLYPDHDLIELFVRERGSQVVVSDLGETLRRLEGCGMSVLDSPPRLFQVRSLLDGLGLDLQRGIIAKSGEHVDVGSLMFDVLAGCKAVADLIYTSRAFAAANFVDEVASFFGERALRCERKVHLAGISGSRYTADLRVTGASQSATIAAVSPTRPGGVRQRVNNVFRMWSDIESVPWPVSLVNDEILVVPPSELELLSRVSEIRYWRDRERLVEQLRAAA